MVASVVAAQTPRNLLAGAIVQVVGVGGAVGAGGGGRKILMTPLKKIKYDPKPSPLSSSSLGAQEIAVTMGTATYSVVRSGTVVVVVVFVVVEVVVGVRITVDVMVGRDETGAVVGATSVVIGDTP